MPASFTPSSTSPLLAASRYRYPSIVPPRRVFPTTRSDVFTRRDSDVRHTVLPDAPSRAQTVPRVSVTKISPSAVAGDGSPVCSVIVPAGLTLHTTCPVDGSIAATLPSAAATTSFSPTQRGVVPTPP